MNAKLPPDFVSQVPHALFPPNLSDILRRQKNYVNDIIIVLT